MMFSIDFSFDFNDQLAREYLKYHNAYYDIGTKVKLRTPSGVKDAIFTGWRRDGKSFKTIEYVNLWDTKYTYSQANNFIVDIIEPVYPNLKKTSEPANQRECPPSWDVEIGWIWYIIIMVVGSIFRDRWMLWIFATAYFFLWKNGLFGGNKK